MGWVALATERFEEVERFYGEALGFPLARDRGRPGGKGVVFDLGGGLRLEILDARTAKPPLALGPASDRCHLVVEVEDADAARRRLKLPTPEPVTTSWGARLFQVRDPDGVPVWFLQWLTPEGDPPHSPP